MAIRKIDKGWYVEVYLGKDPLTNKKIRKTKTCKSSKEAKKFEAEWLVMSENGEIDINGKMLLSDYMDYWFDTYVKVNCAYQTQTRYKTFCDCIKLGIGHIKLEKLSPPIIQKFYSSLLLETIKLKNGTVKNRYSNGTVLKTHKMLHLALKCAVTWQMLHANSCDNVTPPSDDKRDIKIWSIDEVTDFMKLIKGTKLFPAAYLAYVTGMREAEISALKWENVDLENSILKVVHSMVQKKKELALDGTKTDSSERSISIDEDTKNWLRKIKLHQQAENLTRDKDNKINYEYICCSPDGAPLSPQYITKTFTKYVKKYDFKKITFHGLRHTHASILFEVGIQSNVISKRLGHARVSITDDIYIHIKPQMQKEAAKKFGEIIKAQKTKQSLRTDLGQSPKESLK